MYSFAITLITSTILLVCGRTCGITASQIMSPLDQISVTVMVPVTAYRLKVTIRAMDFEQGVLKPSNMNEDRSIWHDPTDENFTKNSRCTPPFGNPQFGALMTHRMGMEWRVCVELHTARPTNLVCSTWEEMMSGRKCLWYLHSYIPFRSHILYS